MERKFATRPNWNRVLQKRYYHTYLETEAFHGHAALLCLDVLSRPLMVKVLGKSVCIADTGYSWLQHFPLGAHYAVTAMFDANNQPVYWYIDICLRTGVDKTGVPWMDDLYLDIAILPNGKVELLDADELQEALQTGAITQEQNDLAIRVASELLGQIAENAFPLLTACITDRETLLATEPTSFQRRG